MPGAVVPPGPTPGTPAKDPAKPKGMRPIAPSGPTFSVMYLLRNSAANCSTVGAQTFTKSSQESSYHPRSLRSLRAAAPFNTNITMRTLTKQQVVSNFRDLWHDRLTHNPTLRGDRTAKRCAFNDYIDFLHKDKHISDTQVTNWTNPF